MTKQPSAWSRRKAATRSSWSPMSHLLRSFLERERRANPEEHDAEDARPVEGDAIEAEEAEAVDGGAHHELAGDQEADRRGGADAGARERDREDDDRAHQCADPQPRRLARGRHVTGEAVTHDEQHDARDRSRAERREGERLEDPDPLAEPAHDRNLDRPGHPGEKRQHDGGGRHRAKLYAHASTTRGRRWSARSCCTSRSPKRRVTSTTSSSAAGSPARRRSVTAPSSGRRWASRGTATTASGSFRTVTRSRRRRAPRSSWRRARTRWRWAESST